MFAIRPETSPARRPFSAQGRKAAGSGERALKSCQKPSRDPMKAAQQRDEQNQYRGQQASAAPASGLRAVSILSREEPRSSSKVQSHDNLPGRHIINRL